MVDIGTNGQSEHFSKHSKNYAQTRKSMLYVLYEHSPCKLVTSSEECSSYKLEAAPFICASVFSYLFVIIVTDNKTFQHIQVKLNLCWIEAHTVLLLLILVHDLFRKRAY